MKKYFYSDGKEKLGPFSFEELKNENINKETLIWFEGLDNWTSAKYILEIEEILQLKPPPIQTNSPEFISSKDETQKSNVDSKIDEDNSKTYFQKKQGMFTNSFSYEGRIRRTEYGISLIIYVFAATIVNVIVKTGEFPIIGLASIPILWFLFAQGAKRCHDMGNSGWYQIIPFYILWMIFAKGENWLNKYGANPKG